MRRGLDWYKREPIAFLDGVQGMGPELIGAYAVLLDLIYARGGETRRDDRHLAGLLGCSLRKARSLTDELIEREKIEVQDGFITNSRAKRQSKSARNIRETRAKSGRKGGEKSAESRKNKGLDEAGASDARAREEKRREEIDGGGNARAREVMPRTNAEIATPREQMLEAIGADPVSGMVGPNGKMIGTRADMEEAARWTALGLSLEDQIAVIREVMASAPEPPRSFSYFTPAMQRLAGARQAGPLQPSQPSKRGNRSHARGPSDAEIGTAAERLYRRLGGS